MWNLNFSATLERLWQRLPSVAQRHLKTHTAFRREPTLELFAAGEGKLGFRTQFGADESLAIYRVRMTYRAPGPAKETRFSVTYDPPQMSSFREVIRLPERWVAAAASETPAIVTVEMLTTDYRSVWRDISIRRFQSVYAGQAQFPLEFGRTVDAPDVASLDFEELQLRKQKLKDLEVKARAKAEAKAGKPAETRPPELTL